jgi:hypothetical protein
MIYGAFFARKYRSYCMGLDNASLSNSNASFQDQVERCFSCATEAGEPGPSEQTWLTVALAIDSNRSLCPQPISATNAARLGHSPVNTRYGHRMKLAAHRKRSGMTSSSHRTVIYLGHRTINVRNTLHCSASAMQLRCIFDLSSRTLATASLQQRLEDVLFAHD